MAESPRAPARWSSLQVLAVGAAVLVGLVIGGLGPRAELRSLRAEIDLLEARPCTGSQVGTRIFSEVLRPPGTPEAGGGPSNPDGEPGDGREAGGGAPRGREGDQRDVERMKDALDVRRAQAAAALRERAAADDAQMAQIDEITSEMNDALRQLATEFVQVANASGSGMPSRRDAMWFAADALDILIEAEESMWGTLDDEQAAGVDPDVLDPTAYIDGTIVDVMAELDGRPPPAVRVDGRPPPVGGR
jgi:hypothetical protein